jgi:hypothetical protein
LPQKKKKKKKEKKIAAQFIKISGSNFSVLNFLIKKPKFSYFRKKLKKKKKGGKKLKKRKSPESKFAVQNFPN